MRTSHQHTIIFLCFCMIDENETIFCGNFKLCEQLVKVDRISSSMIFDIGDEKSLNFTSNFIIVKNMIMKFYHVNHSSRTENENPLIFNVQIFT